MSLCVSISVSYYASVVPCAPTHVLQTRAHTILTKMNALDGATYISKYHKAISSVTLNDNLIGLLKPDIDLDVSRSSIQNAVS